MNINNDKSFMQILNSGYVELNFLRLNIYRKSDWICFCRKL